MDKAINKILQTDDYKRFKRLAGNRDVTEARVNKITNSIQENGYIESPICVNEKFEVIDGQGRLEAFKRLGMTVDYYILPGAGIDECIALNHYSTSWTMKDYIASYAEGGNISYKYLLELMKAYPYMNRNTIYNALTDKAQIQCAVVKSGEFHCTEVDYNRAVKILEYESRFKDIFRFPRGRSEYYYMSIAFCYGLDLVDNERLYKKVTALQTSLTPVANIDQALEIIEKVYNDRMRESHVYIQTEYHKMLEGKYVWYKNKWMEK